MTAVAEPLSTLVPRKQMFERSMAETLPRRSARVGLLDRHGFAGQRRLDDEQVLRGQEPDIAGDHVAGGELHDVAGHELLERDLPGLPVAHHGGGDADHRLELGGGGVGPRFLDEPQRQSQHHHQQHHRAGPEILRWRKDDDRPGRSAESPADCGRRDKAVAASLPASRGRLRWGRIAPGARRLRLPSDRPATSARRRRTSAAS